MSRYSRVSTVQMTVVSCLLIITSIFPVAAGQLSATPDATPVVEEPGDWPMYRADPARTGAVDGPALAGQPVELWRLQLDAPAFRSPAVVDGVLYIGRQDGVVHAVDAASGDELWNFQADAPVQVTPTVVNGSVFIGSENGTLYAVDAGTGEQIWQFAKPLSAYSLPVASDNVLYMGSDDGFLYAIDAASGGEVWAFEAGTPLTRGAAVSDGVVFIGSEDGKLFAVQVDDGTEVWRFDDGIPGDRTVTPTVGDGVVFFAQGGTLHAHDALSGDEVWQAALGDGARAPAYVDGTVYTGGTDGVVYAVDGASGEVLWEFQAEDQFTATPAIVGDTVYAVNWGGFLYALDRATGAEQWRFAIEGDVDNGPSYADGVLYVSTSFGLLYAVGGDGSGVTGTPGAVATPVVGLAREISGAGPVVTVEEPVEHVWTSGPIGFAVSVSVHPKGMLWVPDLENSVIHILSPKDGTLVEDWTDADAGDGLAVTMADAPVGGIVFTEDGGFYAGYVNGVIQQFDPDRQFVQAWGGFGTGEGQFVEIGGISLDAEGNVYVADIGRGDIQKFTADGDYLTTIGEQGSGPGQFDGPSAPSFDAEGNMYIADFRNQRISKLAPDGTFVTSWGSAGSGPGEVGNPDAVKLDDDGNLYIADEQNHRVQVWDAEGRFLAMWGEFGDGDGQFSYVANVELDREGSIYVNDIENRRIQKFRLLPPLGQAGGQPSPVASPVTTIDVSVELLWESRGGPESLSYLADIELGPDANVWILDAAHNPFQMPPRVEQPLSAAVEEGG